MVFGIVAFVEQRTHIPMALVTAASLLAGCASYVNTSAYGPALESEAEIEAYFSGNMLKNVVGGGMYFSPDGTLLSVETRIDQVSVGRWSVQKGAEPKLCMSAQQGAYIFNGETQEFAMDGYCYGVAPLPDGTTRMDATGNPDFVTGRLVEGFPMAARFNEISDRAGLK